MMVPRDKYNSGHYTWGNHCDSWILTESEGLSVKQELMPPGTREKLHFHHHAQQFFYILKGEAKFYVSGDRIKVKEGQGLLIEAGTRHYIANESGADLEFLVTSQPSTTADRIEI